MTGDEENGQDVLENIIADLDRVEALLERAEVTTEAANNRLRIYRERYENEGDTPPMPPDESDFIGGNKDFTEDRDDE